MPKLSIVVPVYRAGLSIQENFRVVKDVLDQHAAEFLYEIILVNDGSPDNSLELMEAIRGEYPAVTGVVNLVRNFGQVAAVFAGLRASTGDCAVVISDDLQDPPELIPEMFRQWQEGHKTVLAVRAKRQDSVTSKVPSRIFYRLMKIYALPSLPSGGFDFFLIDRAVIDRMLIHPEPNGFLQGQILHASGAVCEI